MRLCLFEPFSYENRSGTIGQFLKRANIPFKNRQSRAKQERAECEAAMRCRFDPLTATNNGETDIQTIKAECNG